MSWLNEVHQKFETFKDTILASQIEIPSEVIPAELLSPTTTVENKSPQFRKSLPGSFPLDEAEQSTEDDDEMDNSLLDGIMVQDVSDDEYPLLLPITREVSAATSGTEKPEKEEDSERDELAIINQYAESRSSGETLLPIHPSCRKHTTQPDLPNTSSTFDPLSSSSTLASNDAPRLSDYSALIEQAANNSLSDDTNWSTRPTYSKSKQSVASGAWSFEMERQEDAEDFKLNSTPSFPPYYSFSFNSPSKSTPSKPNNLNKPLPPPPVPRHSHPNTSTPHKSPLSRLCKAKFLNLKNQEKVAKSVDMTTFFGDDTRSGRGTFDKGVPWGFRGRDYQPPMLKEHFLAETMRDMKVRKRGIMEKGGFLGRGKAFVRRCGEKVWDFAV